MSKNDEKNQPTDEAQVESKGTQQKTEGSKAEESKAQEAGAAEGSKKDKTSSPADKDVGATPVKDLAKHDHVGTDEVLIDVQDLHKAYGPIDAVDHISFQVRRGEVVGILGPNGAGKSTTMKMLTCLLAPTGGRAKIAGHDTLTESMAVRRSIGYLPEDTPVYPAMSVLEFLQFVAEVRDVPKKDRKRRIKETCELTGLTSVLGRPIGELSKGYRQRVGLAQAMVHDPSILIMDEPWTGLDPNQIADVRNLIKALGKDKTLLVSTHILAEVEAVCDRIVIIDHGKILEDGRPQDVIDRNGQAMYRFEMNPNGKEADDFAVPARSVAGVASVEVTRHNGNLLAKVVCRKGKDPGQPKLLSVVQSAGMSLVAVERSITSLEDIFRTMTVGDAVEIGAAA
ncbi:MAG: ATP-binding cassette domain-containing protein [Deltaproteobacteria bacterium]|nr:ATP-binding cassette domain-containing protein [Deltaproteobacteria bacterium]